MSFQNIRLACLKILVQSILILSVIGFFNLQVQALGVTGTFSSRDFVLIPGESIASDSVYVTFVNTGKDSLNLELSTMAPQGVRLEVQPSQLILEPEASIRIPVAINILPEAIPGNWIIGVKATAQRSTATGLSLLGSAQLRASLTILGEAATLNIKTVTLDGMAFPTELWLYRINPDGSLSLSGEGQGGELEKRVATGTYRLKILAQSEILHSEDFILKDQEHLEKTFELSQILFKHFSCLPLTSNQERLKCSYHLINLHQTKDNLSLELKIAKDGKEIDRLVLEDHLLLESGSTINDFLYAPVQGWDNGTYLLTLSVKDSEGISWSKMQAQAFRLEFKEKNPVLWNWILGVLFILILLGWITRKMHKGISE